MLHSSRSQYLEGKIQTSSQPQLHLLLLDGALRFGRQAHQRWGDDADLGEVAPLLERMSDIVEELTYSVAKSEENLSKDFEEQYAFIFRELCASRINEDRSKLDNCLKLLEFERGTWKLACEKLEPSPAAAATTIVPPMHSASSLPSGMPSEGLSLEA